MYWTRVTKNYCACTHRIIFHYYLSNMHVSNTCDQKILRMHAHDNISLLFVKHACIEHVWPQMITKNIAAYVSIDNSRRYKSLQHVWSEYFIYVLTTHAATNYSKFAVVNTDCIQFTITTTTIIFIRKYTWFVMK